MVVSCNNGRPWLAQRNSTGLADGCFRCTAGESVPFLVSFPHASPVDCCAGRAARHIGMN
eukprot:12995283-Alexandrium_andersonii.AAC.1